MNVHDKVSKAVWHMVQGIKDQVSANLVSAASSKKIKIDPNALVHVIALVNQSIEQSYHGGVKSIVAEVNDAAVAAKAHDSKKKH